MRATKQLSVTIPNAMAAEIRARVASGEYASESEVIRDGLRALRARERATEDWLKGDVVNAFDALRADPDRARSPDALAVTLAREHDNATKSR